MPGSLDESLGALEADNDFLKAGGVFTDDLIETWIAYKRVNEIDAIRLRPAPLGVHALLRHLIGPVADLRRWCRPSGVDLS